MADEAISLKVRSQAGDEVTFKVKPSTKFQKIFIAYVSEFKLGTPGAITRASIFDRFTF